MPLLLPPSITPRMPRPCSVSTITTSIGLAVAQWIVHTSGTVLIALRTFTGKKARARYLANSIIAPSVPRQRTSDTERLAKSDAKFDPTNGLH